MNEVTTENADRFHKPASETSDSKNYLMLEYAPDLYICETRIKHFKFTVGKKYPVIEKRHDQLGYKVNYGFKTLNDNQELVWVDEKYFIPANVPLMHESDVDGGFTTKRSNLDWDAAADDGFVNLCDIRKMASEKKVKPLEIVGEGSLVGDGSLDGQMSESIVKDILTLSGQKDPKIVVAIEPIGDCAEYKSHTFKVHEGVVKDIGNELMNDGMKCAMAIDKVFGNKQIADSDEIIKAIRKNMLRCDLSFEWKNNVLYVGDARTKILHNEVQAAYSGLRSLVSAKSAEKIVGKLVANQLKKVF